MSLRSLLLIAFCAGLMAACYGPSTLPYPNANQQGYHGVAPPSQTSPNGEGPPAD